MALSGTTSDVQVFLKRERYGSTSVGVFLKDRSLDVEKKNREARRKEKVC